MSFFKSDANLSDPNHRPLPEEEQLVLDKIARKTVQWGAGMTVVAIMTLESMKPANFIMSQVLVFFEPIIQSVFTIKDYDTFRSALEKRETIEILIQKIEEYDVIAKKREKLFNKWYKQEKKNWKWYQRYLGVFLPKLDCPDEIKELDAQLKVQLNPKDDAEEQSGPAS
jgi:ASC-1-like (ASCH) protein